MAGTQAFHSGRFESAADAWQSASDLADAAKDAGLKADAMIDLAAAQQLLGGNRRDSKPVAASAR